MSNEKIIKLDTDTILPYGERLRPLIASAFFSKGDLKKVLARKGVFFSSSDKDMTVPTLTTCLLSPNEFEDLRECQRTKEESIKRITRKIDWDTNLTLFDALKKTKLPYNEFISKGGATYKFLDTTDFLPIGDEKNELRLSYRIERKDPTKDWVNSDSRHGSEITLKKVDGGKVLEISMEYTTSETKEIDDKIFDHLKAYLKDNNYIRNDKEEVRIRFGDFSNQERLKFLLSLHNDDPFDVFKFKEITNVEISVDKTQPLPKDIKWMENKVRNMILKGEKLHDMELLKNTQYHVALIVSGIEAKYNFESPASKGVCTIEYGFHSSRSGVPNKDSEFEFRIISSFVKSNKPKKTVERFLLAKFDRFKSNMLKSFKTE